MGTYSLPPYLSYNNFLIHQLPQIGLRIILETSDEWCRNHVRLTELKYSYNVDERSIRTQDYAPKISLGGGCCGQLSRQYGLTYP